MDQLTPVFTPVSVGAIFASIIGWLPPIAAVLSIIWFVICIYESRTFQHWRANRQMKHRARKLARLRAQEKIVLAEIQAMETVRSARVEAREVVASAKSEAAQLIVQEAFVDAEKKPAE